MLAINLSVVWRGTREIALCRALGGIDGRVWNVDVMARWPYTGKAVLWRAVPRAQGAPRSAVQRREATDAHAEHQGEGG